jgi:hypothetical protein
MGTHKHTLVQACISNPDGTVMKALAEFVLSLPVDVRYLFHQCNVMNGFVFITFYDIGSKCGWDHAAEIAGHRARLITILRHYDIGYDGGVQCWCEFQLYKEDSDEGSGMTILQHGRIH